MVCRMRDTSSHHPGARPLHVEKRGFAFPPFLIPGPERPDAFSTVLFISPDELEPDFFCRQRRSADIDIEHRSKPDVLADTLMHHMLMEAPAARIDRMRTYGKIVIGEHAPGTDHLDALRVICIDQKLVSHQESPVLSLGCP